jgi:hypothetical protein
VKRRTVRRAVQPADVETVEVTETDGENADKLAAIIEALSDAPLDDNWTADVYVVEKGQSPEFIWRVPASDVATLRERVRDEPALGSGTYRVIVRQNEIIRQCGNFRVRRLDVRQPVPVVAQPAPGHDMIAVLLQRMEQQNQMMLEIMRRPAQPSPAGDPFQQLERLSAVMANLQGNKGDTAMGLVMQGVTLATQLEKTASGDGGGIAGMVEKFLESPALGELMKAFAAARAAPVPPAAGAPGAIVVRPSNGAASAVAASSPAADAGQMELAGQLQFLCQRAAANNDPEPYAKMLMDLMPPAYLDMALRQPNPFADFHGICPDMLKFPEWFQEMLDIIRDIVADAMQPAGDGEENPSSAGAPSASEVLPAAGRAGRAGNREKDAR